MNKLFDFGREGFLTGQIDWSTHTIRAVLIDISNYVVDLAHDQWLADIPAAARVATSNPLGSKTTTAGVADAADVVFSAVSGATCSAIVIYRDTGNASTSRLIAYLPSAVGLPVQPSGIDITIEWDSGSNKIFRL